MENLKSQVRELTAKRQIEQELADCYELGKRAAWDNRTIDDHPRYRKQNKIAAWLKGFADGKQEKEAKALQGNINKAGIAKLKSLVQQVQ